MRAFFNELDTKGKGKVDIHEFRLHLRNEKMAAYLSFLGIDASHAKNLFKLLSDDGTRALTADEFVNGCMRVRGGAKGIDIALVMDELALTNDKLSTLKR